MEPGDLEAAQAAMRLLRGGDTKAMLAAALEAATRFARGYRIEYADVEGGAPLAAELVVVAPPVSGVSRSPFARVLA